MSFDHNSKMFKPFHTKYCVALQLGFIKNCVLLPWDGGMDHLIGETVFNPKKPSDIKTFRATAKRCESRLILEMSMARGPVATHSGSREIVYNVKETDSAISNVIDGVDFGI